MADRAGLVVIDETPAVGQWDMMKSRAGIAQAGAGTGADRRARFFDDEAVKTTGKEAHKDVIRELMKRDKNHPCVVMWSISNEPDTSIPSSDEYFEDVFAFARTQDPQNAEDAGNFNYGGISVERPRTFPLGNPLEVICFSDGVSKESVRLRVGRTQERAEAGQ